MADLSTDSLAPAQVTSSSTFFLSSLTNLVRFSQRIWSWISSLSPDGATVYDTGWVNIALAPGFTARSGFACQVRRIGKVVKLRGIIDGNFTTSFQAIATVPAAFTPSGSEYWKGFMPGAANHGSLNINTSGLIQGSSNVALTGSYVSIVHTWMVE